MDALRAAHEKRWNYDQEISQGLGRRIVEHVRMAMEVRERAFDRPLPEIPAKHRASEERLAERRTECLAAAEAARRKHGKRPHKKPAELETAVEELCAAEYGAILGFPYDPRDRAVMGPVADLIAPIEQRARDAYTALRKAITKVREIAFERGHPMGAAGHALLAARRILPVLPDLNDLPFADHLSSGRGAFVRETEDRWRRLIPDRTFSDRELAVMSLLQGYRPRGGYEILLKRRPQGMTAAQVIDEEAKCVRRVRGGPVRKPPT